MFSNLTGGRGTGQALGRGEPAELSGRVRLAVGGGCRLPLLSQPVRLLGVGRGRSSGGGGRPRG